MASRQRSLLELADAAPFVAPFLVIFLVFLGYPILYSFLLSFQDLGDSFALGDLKFVGLANFKRLATDPEFLWSLVVTLFYAVLIIPSGILTSLMLALLLREAGAGSKLFRVAYFLPNVLDTLVIGIIWTMIYSRGGIADSIFRRLYGFLDPGPWAQFAAGPLHGAIALVVWIGIEGLFVATIAFAYRAWASRGGRMGPDLSRMFGAGALVAGVLWAAFGSAPALLAGFIRPAIDQGILANSITVMPAVIFALVLKGAGFGMVLFVAAIQNISKDVYEAADLDGADRFDVFFRITLPLLAPIIVFMVVTGTIGALNAFTEIFAMTKGEPTISFAGHTLGVTKVTGYYLFSKWEACDYGYAAAISYALLVLTLAVTRTSQKFFGSGQPA